MLFLHICFHCLLNLRLWLALLYLLYCVVDLFACLFILFLLFFFELGFTPCKAEHPLRGIELQEKEAQKD